MDNGAGLTSHGFQNLGVESAGMQNHETVPPSAWPSVWKARTSSCGAHSWFPENDDGEDYMSGLAEEIAQCMLEDTDDGSRAHDCSAFLSAESAWGAQAFLSTSPQSTLAGMSSWDLLSPGASSNGGLSSGVSSPPTPVATSHVRNEEDDALDLLYAELLRLKMEDEIKARQQQLLQLKQQQHYQQLLWKMRQRQAASLSYEAVEALKFVRGGAHLVTFSSLQKVPGSTSPFFKSKARNEETNQARARKQLSGTWAGNQNQSVRQRSWSATDQSNQGQSHFTAYASNGAQHKGVNGSGMRAVFLGTPGARESGGTGVFLPRRLGNGHDNKRKPACSTVLLPSRIVQALNLNVEDTLVPNSSPASVHLRRDSVPARAKSPTVLAEVVDPRDSNWAAHPHPAAPCFPLQEVAPDICLPTEWTY